MRIYRQPIDNCLRGDDPFGRRSTGQVTFPLCEIVRAWVTVFSPPNSTCKLQIDYSYESV